MNRVNFEQTNNFNDYFSQLDSLLINGGNVEELNKKLEELRALKEKTEKYFNAFEKKKLEIEAKLITPEKVTISTLIEETPKKASQIALSSLVIHKDQVVKSTDGSGDREHYAVSFISNTGEEIEVTKTPIDVKKYGEIKKIIISDGKKETLLDGEYDMVHRLIKYFSIDFEVLRKEMNELDHNGFYLNKYGNFDCQKFSYYLKNGKEKDYSIRFHGETSFKYRTEVNHRNYSCYSMKAQTAGFGSGGSYSDKDMSLHHYICLVDDVFVSKFGKSDVLFTSFQHILDAYFPPKFIKGSSTREFS